MSQSPYDEGLEAFWSGESIYANPYEAGEPEFEEWEEGYGNADAQESGEFD